MVHCPSVGKLKLVGATVAWWTTCCSRPMAFWARRVFPGVVLAGGGHANSMYNSRLGVLTTYPKNPGCPPAAVDSVAAPAAVDSVAAP